MTKILLIDDEEMIRKCVRSILKSENYVLEEASEAEPVLNMLRKNPVDIVISDLFLPGKDGLKLIEEVRGNFPTIKIIAITGGGLHLFDPENALKVAKRSGADYTLMKPIKRKDLLSALKMLMDQAPISSKNDEEETPSKEIF